MVFMLLSCLALYYVLMALRLFTVWLKLFRRDPSVSQSEVPEHLMILVIITILWPLVVPFAYLELLHAKQTVESSYNKGTRSFSASKTSTLIR